MPKLSHEDLTLPEQTNKPNATKSHSKPQTGSVSKGNFGKDSFALCYYPMTYKKGHSKIVVTSLVVFGLLGDSAPFNQYV